MDKLIKENKVISGFILVLIIFGIYHYLQFNRKTAYKLDTDCSKFSSSFAKKRDGIPMWNVLQSKFSKDQNSCFAEFDTGGDIFVIYDLTHNKQIALKPANASELYPDAPYGEISDVRIEHMKNYIEMKEEIFGLEKYFNPRI